VYYLVLILSAAGEGGHGALVRNSPTSRFGEIEVAMLNKAFTAKLQKSPSKGGWTYVVWPQSVKFFGTRGLVKVSGRIDGHPFRSSFMAMGDGMHMLPVKADIREAISKDVGDTVRVILEERITVNKTRS
jgi:hypothetical protein